MPRCFRSLTFEHSDLFVICRLVLGPSSPSVLMLRSCLLMLVVYAALFAGYYWWIGPQFDPPWVYVGVGVVALIAAGSLGALINARMYYRDWSLLAAARHNLPWVDGRWTA